MQLDIRLTCSDNSPPLAGSVVSESGPYSIDNTKLKFTWQQFDDPETGIRDYQVAFGNSQNHEEFQTFRSLGVTDEITFLPTDFPSNFLGGKFHNGQYFCTVRAVNGAGLISDAVSASVIVDPTALAVGDTIPLPEGYNWDQINWTNTTFEPETHVIMIEDAEKLIVGDYGGTITITYHFIDEIDPIERQYVTSCIPHPQNK